MKSVGVYEAKTQLPRLLDEVERGETIEITRYGRAVARLVPVNGEQVNVAETISAIRASRKGHRLAGLTARELINEGRPG
jgi:prevent-host-death family protein